MSGIKIRRGTCMRCGLDFVYCTSSRAAPRKYCNVCRSPNTREQKAQRSRWYRATPEGKAAALETMRRYTATPEGKAAILENQRKRRATPEGRAIYLEAQRSYRATPEGRAALSQSRARYYSSPEGRASFALAGAKRRERSTDPESYAARVELLHIMEEPCACCQTSYKITHQVDHIIALCLGGTDDWKNLQPLCILCHREKTREDNHKLKEGVPK